MEIKDLNSIQTEYDAIFLQPHFDDAALSCGGLIASLSRSHHRILVIAVFGGAPTSPIYHTPFVRETHLTMGFDGTIADVISARRLEDKSACNLMGVDYCWLDFPEALYRHYDSRDELFGTVKDSDYALSRALSDLLGELGRMTPHSHLYVPLGIGDHVDHQILHASARSSTITGKRIYFYEDFPYSVLVDPAYFVWEKRGLDLRPTVIDVSNSIETKLEAMLLYQSQISFLMSFLLKENTPTKEAPARLESIVRQYGHSIASDRLPSIGQHQPVFERYWTT